MTKAVARRAGGRAFGIGAASASSYRVGARRQVMRLFLLSGDKLFQ
ncbi:hypothetical protein PCI56_18975 [Plesiomonas shigelloides subsp. oncorhynchi]|nr:hypothetical protein [Plesiomonas shigelloides]